MVLGTIIGGILPQPTGLIPLNPLETIDEDHQLALMVFVYFVDLFNNAFFLYQFFLIRY